MKPVLFLAVTLVSLNALAQKNISITHSINDDGNRLSIIIKGTANGKPIDYNRVFNVSNMNTAERNALKERVYDSLGLSAPTPPHPPIAPRQPITTRESVTVTEPVATGPPLAPNAPVISATSGYSELYSIGGDHPYTKEIRYNPATGMLTMKYRFMKNKEEVTIEKTIDAKDKSKEERDEIIRKYEREIGIVKREV